MLLESDLAGNEAETSNRSEEREASPRPPGPGERQGVTIPLSGLPDGGIKGKIVKRGVLRFPLPEKMPDGGVTISLAPPDAGHRSTAAPIAPGDVLPELGPPRSAADLEIERALAEQELGTSPCQHSFDILRQVSQGANKALPHRVRYLEACNAMPFMMQRCLDPGYRAENEDDCSAIRDSMDPMLLERFRRVVAGE